jgi:hypothetical protein
MLGIAFSPCMENAQKSRSGKGKRGLVFLSVYRYGRAVSHISAQDVDPRRWLKNSTITAFPH